MPTAFSTNTPVKNYANSSFNKHPREEFVIFHMSQHA
jgi:hypothetical protein